MLIVVNNPLFIIAVDNTRKKFNINTELFTVDKNNHVARWYNDLSKNNKLKDFSSSLNKLLIDHKLPNNFYNAIKHYVFYNEIARIPATNCNIDFSDKEIIVRIFQKPTRDEWSFVKKDIDKFLELSLKQKISFLDKHNYPHGSKILKPKPNIKRDQKILTLSKKRGERLSGFNFEYNYSDSDIEADIWGDESNNSNLKKHKNIIKKVRSVSRKLKE